MDNTKYDPEKVGPSRRTVLLGAGSAGAVVLLTACGSHGASNSPQPAGGATNVSRSALTIVYFSKAMDKAATQAAFSLKRTSDGAPVSGSFGWYGPGVLLFKPDVDLAAGTQYTASVSASAKDLGGNTLATPVAWSYTTGG